MDPSALTPSIYVLGHRGRSSPTTPKQGSLLPSSSRPLHLSCTELSLIWASPSRAPSCSGSLEMGGEQNGVLFCHPLRRWLNMGTLRVKMGVAPLFALLLLLMGCADAARDISIPIFDGVARTRSYLDDHLKLDELAKLFQNEAVSLNGLPTEFCRPCLEISRKAKKMLTGPSLFNEIDYLASSFCHILPSDLEVKCIKMVDMRKHEAVMFLQDAFTEESFCYNSGFCRDKAEKSLPLSERETELLTAMEPFIKLLNKLQKGLMMEGASGIMKSAKTFTLKEIPVELRSNGTCMACHNVLDKVRNELQDPDKQLKIITALLKACEIEVFVYRCKKLVFAYGPLVISNLQRIVSMDLCHMAHLCEDPRNQSSHMNMNNFGTSRQHLQSALAKLNVL